MSKPYRWNVVCLAVAGVALSLLATNVVRADSFSDKAATLDIVGVHLGMTPAEAKSSLAQHRKGMQWVADKAPTGAEARWDISERVYLDFSPPPGEPKVMAVLRSVWFDKSNAPTVEGLASSLTDKFGQPTENSQDSPRSLFWGWDEAGQVSKATSVVCNPVVENNKSRWGIASPAFIPDLQKENDNGCALAVEAIIRVDSPGGIAGQLDMALVDTHDALRAAIAADNHVKQVEQAKKEEELKNASANKQPAL